MAKRKPATATALKVSPQTPLPAVTNDASPKSGLMAAATGSENRFSQEQMIVEALGGNSSVSKDPKVAVDQMFGAIEFLEGLVPKDGLERMLVFQMLRTHHAAMKCLAAAAPPNTLPLIDMYSRHAEKLLAMFLRQMEAFDKHRSKGQQNLTVGHLHFQQGGQSLVANVQITPDVSPPDNQSPGDRSLCPADGGR